jgi:hypothetical protein
MRDVSRPLIPLLFTSDVSHPLIPLLLLSDVGHHLILLLLMRDVSHPLISFGIDERRQPPTYLSVIDEQHSHFPLLLM